MLQTAFADLGAQAVACLQGVSSAVAACNLTVASAFTTGPDVTIIGSCVVLLTVASPRNIHLSDRSRANVDEALYKVLPSTVMNAQDKRRRLASLRYQTRLFDKRYRRMSGAFAFLTVSTVGYILATVLGLKAQCLQHWSCSAGDYLMTEWSGFLSLVSLAPLLYALAQLFMEFYQGPRTLRNNSSAFGLAGRIARAPKENAHRELRSHRLRADP